MKLLPLALALVAATCLLGGTSLATEDVPEIRFYNRTTTVGVCTDRRPQDISFKDTRGFRNDEARRLSLINVRAGARIYLFDSPAASTSDDWTYIYVKRKTWQGIFISSFERSYENDDVSVTYHRKNGLNGKVSFCRIR